MPSALLQEEVEEKRVSAENIGELEGLIDQLSANCDKLKTEYLYFWAPEAGDGYFTKTLTPEVGDIAIGYGTRISKNMDTVTIDAVGTDTITIDSVVYTRDSTEDFALFE